MMKRRDFSVACGSVLAASALFSPLAQAQAKKPEEGSEYLVLDKRAPVEAAAGRIEVVEFFWYSCPHCNAFEPTLDAWVKALPKDVSFRRVPVAFRDDFVPQQRLFYALEAMDLVDKLQTKVFHAIHVERQRLDQPQAIIDWVAKQGVDKAKFSEHFSSFSVASKATRGTQLQNAYKVEGVPSIGIAGRFYTDGSIARSMDRVLQVTDYLVGQVRLKR
jgi:thiol:disulfide interchange protein DsbA